MKYKNILFDFDGTIADSFAESIEALNRLSHFFGYQQITEEHIPEIRKMTSRQLIEISGVSKYKLPFLLYSAKRLIHKSLNEMPVCTGMYETIYELKKRGFYIGIISSNTESNIEKYLEMKNINIFNFVKGERNIFGKAKVIKKMMEKKKLNPNETIYVGDEIRDIDSAREAGIKIISVTWGFNTAESLAEKNPDYILHDAHKIFEIIA